MNRTIYFFEVLENWARLSWNILTTVKHRKNAEASLKANVWGRYDRVFSIFIVFTVFSSLHAAGAASLSQLYPGDIEIGNDQSVLLHDDFETGWGKWNSPANDTKYLSIKKDVGVAHSGSRYLDSTVTFDHLQENQYISASPKFTFANRVNEVFLRFYVKFPEMAPPPHHWIRFSAGDEGYFSSGLANTVPNSDEGFWFDFDLNINYENRFYVYWHEMRSGRCNDGSPTPGCAGDQGTTYFYGNKFKPLEQPPYDMNKWYCIEISAKTNQIDEYDGELKYWVNDNLVGEFGPGIPDGTWLRDTFHVGGCSYSSCEEPSPLEGFNFRANTEVRFKQIFLDAYYQRDTSEDKRNRLLDMGYTVSDNQTIFYDDVVLATSRIGCKTDPDAGSLKIPNSPVIEVIQ